MEFWLGVFVTLAVECFAALAWYLAPMGDPETGTGRIEEHAQRPMAANPCEAQRTPVHKTR